ncbi:MAG TPA: glycogen debranching N-terminal domain-containing protein [Thermomicrobiales bacterium]|jgi:glycogen debranching enzyme|nr:glycogen debranching N-terminal domain-containing protein [Thermomicrobiales bacterium]
MLRTDVTLKADELFLAGQKESDGSGEQAAGIYARDTRFVERIDLTINGTSPSLLAVRQTAPNAAVFIATNEGFELDGATVYGHTLAVTQELTLTDVVTVRVTIHNHGQVALRPEIGLTIGSDFRDLFAIRGFPPSPPGQYQATTVIPGGFSLGYRAPDDEAVGLDVRFDQAPVDVTEVVSDGGEETTRRLRSSPVFRESADGNRGVAGNATFGPELSAGGEWELVATITLRTAGPRPLSAVASLPGDAPLQRATIRTSSPQVNAILDRATADMAMLQTTFDAGSVIAAGAPWFIAPFGRDSLIACLQTLPLGPERAAATLRVLAAWQATEADAWRDAEPGKILHEMRSGEMARARHVPHTPYYGTVDATPLFAWLVADTVAWTGDEALWRELQPHARAAVGWMLGPGDLDGDGLIEHPNREPDGVHITNQGWKDSWDSLNGADGQPPTGHIALIEVQGYAFAAYRRLAAVARLHGDDDWAEELDGHAERIRELVERLFWLEDAGTYAQALDGDKRPVAVVSSSPGHLLLAGLPSPDRAARVVDSLTDEAMSTGWGIRTLATTAPTYNPMSYHNGSVWPHDNSLVVSGMALAGHGDRAARVFDDLVDAAATDPMNRLPELFCGYARDGLAATAPVPYPVSCIPQAWAAGAVPFMLTSLLGLSISDDGATVSVDPTLPSSLDWVEVAGLRAGGQDVMVRVERDGDGYAITRSGPDR